MCGDEPNAVVFVHGWTCNRYHWRDQVQTFSNRYRTIAIDLAGHGESGLGRLKYTMPAFADDVVAVLDQEEISRAVLVGHSMGGMVILHAARILGQRVVGLVGADTFKYLRDDPPTGKQAEQARYIASDYETAIKRIVLNMFTVESPEALKKSISSGMISVPREVAIGAMQGMAEDEPLHDLAAALKMPKMTINAIGRPMDREVAESAGVEVRFVTTGGHFVMNEDPETFNRHLAELLERAF